MANSAASPLAAGPVQVAYAVHDVIQAAQAWSSRGIGPFFIREHIEVENSRVRGVPTPFDHSSAYGWWGETMVELICDHSATPAGPTVGMHHQAFFVEDFTQAQHWLTSAGWTELLFAQAGETPFAMHDATADLGHLVEIYEPNDRLTGFYAMVRAAARTWTGDEPVRML